MINRKIGTIDGVALLENPLQRVDVHVGGDTGKIGDQAADRYVDHRTPAFQHFHLYLVADSRPEDFR